MIITLSGSAPPADQIHDQIRGLVSTGRLAADERLPSVRQLAKDLGVAPGTVGKAYRALEAEGLLVSRTGSGTRVSPTASTTTRPVLEAARNLAGASTRAGTSLDETIRILRAIWPAPPTPEANRRQRPDTP
ncbi:GntR family transcriptional regulator [Sanguibacter sp. 25GB23B1]|uniref:GntR family transcriptional regulator n=1 Tax=unclassified Sanguibacter TaxID=2645534 RepID=UPI0032AEF342